jgi:hypothetical protein
MPIQSRLPSDTAFDPETIRILTAAFEDAWQTLGGRNSIGPGKQAKREELARIIIGMGQAGERDPAKLRDGALAVMRQIKSA